MINTKKICFALFLLYIVPFALQAQEREITGTVRDANGLEMLGVAVTVKGEQKSTQTDFDGKYHIKTEKGKTLEFSFLGMKTKTFVVGGNNRIDVVLEEETHDLEEVVVTGVGVATDKRKVAISVDAVSEQSLKKIPVKSIDDALGGKIAGAQIQSMSGQPGQQANIILRGINSLGSTQPMIMVDGVQVNATNASVGFDSSNVSSRLSDLDLSNVERVEVIQGAAAATIYGAQGANGVIQIFTKRGKKGQRTEFSYNSSLSLDNALSGNLTYAKYHYYKTDTQGYIVDGNNRPIKVDPTTGYWTLPDETVDGNTILNKPYKEKTYDHLKQFYKTAYTYQQSLNITGATGNVDYAVGATLFNQSSTTFGRYLKKNFNANFGVELFKNFTLRSGTQLITSNNTASDINGRDTTYGSSNVYRAFPFVDINYITTAGTPFVNFHPGENSVMPAYMYHFRTSNSDVNRVIQTISANYKLSQHIDLDYKYGLDHTRYENRDFIKNQTKTTTPSKGITPFVGQLSVSQTRTTFQNSLLNLFARFDFEKDFKWNFPLQSTTQLSYDWRKTTDYLHQSVGTGYGQEPPFTISNANSATSEDYTQEFVTFGWLVNQKFDYSNLFGFSVGVRSDYSSAFGKGGKPFTFPRGDAYFRLSEFIKNDRIYDLKLRAAYGEAGIQPNAYDRLLSLSNAKFGTRGYYYLPTTARNPELGVEKTREFEVGLDYTFRLGEHWFHRIGGTAAYWARKSQGSIYDISTPPSLGANKIKDNAISLSSNGLQLSLDLNVFSNDQIDWNFATRFSKGKTMVDEISNHKTIVVGAAGSGQTSIKEGEPVGAFYGFKPLTSLTQTNSKGVRYIADADLNKYEIVNGYVVNKTDKTVMFTTEQERIGDATPDFTMSFFNDITLYKKLTLSVQVDWTQGGNIYNASKQWIYNDKIHADFEKPVTIGGQTAPFVAYHHSFYQTARSNAYFVEDGTYVRLRNVSLSYDMGKILEDTFIKGLTITASARNLLTFTNYSGVDPEAVGTNVNNPLYRGIDLWTFPNTRSYTMALAIRF